ncbi:N-acetylmuramoyl-L-alanine amidase family protein [Clostridium botulinum]|nr:N-acetylmuramoyl-L-alanine amidase family protein [Clostridium botulinum]
MADGTTSSSKEVRNATYIQKISKAQGDKEDDAYLPKSVASYEVTKNILDCGDADDAKDAIDEATDFTVIDGSIYAIRVKSDNVKVSKINLKKDKVKYESNRPSELVEDDKVDVYLAEQDCDDDQDVESGAKSYSVDVDGNVWVINEGKIYKFVKDEFKEMYTCDKSFDELNVYDEGSLVAWNNDKDAYTTLQEGKKVTEDEATEIVTPAKQAGWEKQADGTWVLYDTTGNMVKGWAPVGGQWYYMNEDGKMATGWKEVNGTWYFLNGSGAMQTGWYSDNGTWYYLNASGAMQTGWVAVAGNWYKLNQSGQMQTGWIQDNGTWYFCEGSGKMLANTTVNGYVLGANGAWIR